jgi:hypothetical protein
MKKTTKTIKKVVNKKKIAELTLAQKVELYISTKSRAIKDAIVDFFVKIKNGVVMFFDIVRAKIRQMMTKPELQPANA